MQVGAEVGMVEQGLVYLFPLLAHITEATSWIVDALQLCGDLGGIVVNIPYKVILLQGRQVAGSAEIYIGVAFVGTGQAVAVRLECQ